MSRERWTTRQRGNNHILAEMSQTFMLVCATFGIYRCCNDVGFFQLNIHCFTYMDILSIHLIYVMWIIVWALSGFVSYIRMCNTSLCLDPGHNEDVRAVMLFMWVILGVENGCSTLRKVQAHVTNLLTWWRCDDAHKCQNFGKCWRTIRVDLVVNSLNKGN